MRNVIRIVCVVSAFFLIVPIAGAAQSEPDVIYYNGKIVTLDSTESVAGAVAVKDGKFLKIGSADEVKKLAGPSTKMVDLGGKTVVPGLIDGHTHPVEAARMKEKWVDCRYPGTRSVREALEHIAVRAKVTPKGEWIFAAAASGSENKFEEKRIPNKADLDKAAPDNPTVFLNGAHESVVNSLAIEKMGITRDMKKLKHGGIIMRDKDGNPTGDMIESEGDVPDSPTEEDLVRYYSKSVPEMWNQNGFTSILGLTNAQTLPVLNMVAVSKDAPHTLRWTVPVWTDPAGKMLPQNLSTLSVLKEADPAWFRTGGVKVWIDGEPDARTGAVYEPYLGHFPTDVPGGKGILNSTQEEADSLASRIDGAGLMCLFHCSADHSTDIGLNAYENLLKAGKPENILRIEHFGVFMLSDEQLKRAVDMGIKVSVQPAWLTTLGKSNYENLGKERADTAFRFRSMIDAGLEPSGGTDVTGIYLVTLNPFLHMWASVTRNSDMGIFQPEQAVTATEALKMWTIWAAKAMGEADLKGSIEPGKYADMTVLSGDILTMPKEDIKDLKAVKTIVGGNIVYDAK